MAVLTKAQAVAARVELDISPVEALINEHLTAQRTIDYVTNPDQANPAIRVNVDGAVLTVAAAAALKTAIEDAGWKDVEVIQEAKRLVVAFSVKEKTPPAPDVYVVTVTPASPTVKIGATVKLVVAVTKNGSPFVGAAPTFVSKTPATATVIADGTVTGVAAGSVVVTVKEGSLYTKDVTVTVTV